MESKHGRLDESEDRSLRQRSKVPRARYQQQRCEHPDFGQHRGGPLKPGTAVQNPGPDTDEFKEWQRVVGERVCIGGAKQGVLRYFGRTSFAQGYWCGVELDEPVGKNDGSVHGTAYFRCRPSHGVFAPVGKVSRLGRDWDENPGSRLDQGEDWDFGPRNGGDATFVKASPSDPSLLRTCGRTSLPCMSESFPYDKRSLTERHSFGGRDVRREPSESTLERPGGSFSTRTPSHVLAKYGYGARNQSDVVQAAAGKHQQRDDVFEAAREQQHASWSEHPQSVPKKASAKAAAKHLMEEFEHYLCGAAAAASPMSSEHRTFGEIGLLDYKLPEDVMNAYGSRDYPDPEDEMDNDESLGILTPSQMRDLSLCPGLPLSCGDARGLDFPSSESFDDINELPEDEQVDKVSVQYLPESSSAKRVLEVAKRIGRSAGSEAKPEDSQMVSSTDDFLFSISQKTFDEFSSSYLSGRDSSQNVSSTSLDCTIKLNNLSGINVLNGTILEKEMPEKMDFGLESYPSAFSKDPVLKTDAFNPACTTVAAFSQYSETVQVAKAAENPNLSDSNKIALMRNLASESDSFSRKNYDSDSSRDSLLPAESEHGLNVKEKLTVSWEDCVTQASDSAFASMERPESVYTVASSDTGFQEDVEIDGGMATSLDSTESNKRFSTTSRDSCLAAEEVDGYKLAESNSTSGYSTGLSDSCCNDRPEDETSKRLTDEEIQDSCGPCDSEDAFSLNENSLSKDNGAVTSEVTVDTVTALRHDSTSDGLCVTMVEDATLTEINELLMSPEDTQGAPAAESDLAADPSQEISESSSLKTTDKTASSVSTPKSTPEKRPNVNSRTVTRSHARTTSRNLVDADSRKQLARSPKKNVMSKIKAMIEATSCKTTTKKKPEASEVAVPRRAPSAPKRSRWESVTSKIAASLAEEKTKPKTRREVKGRVDTNLTLARQQACMSPKHQDGTASPVSTAVRKPLSERNSAPSALRESRVSCRDARSGPKSPRPGRANVSTRSNSPGAASESSTTSVSLASHNSKSKIAHWKGSNRSVASSTAPAPSTATLRRQNAAPPTKPPLQTTRSASQRVVTKKTNATPSTNRQATRSARVRPPSPPTKTVVKEKVPRKEQAGTRGVTPTVVKGGPVRFPLWLSKAELSQEIQRLSTLCEARTKELNRLKMETKHVSVGFDAFAALFKYMVEDLNGLSVPTLTEDLQKTLKQLELTKQDLAFYEKEVEEIKSHHCQELNDLSNKLFEVFQSEVAELNAKHQEEINHQKNDHENQVEMLRATYDASTAETKAQSDKMISSMEQEIIKQREELELFHERELKDLEEKHAGGTKVLQEHIEQLQKKNTDLKQHVMNMEDAMQKDTDSKLQWVSSAKSDLEKEVESLKAVLEMKNKELHTLRVQNLEMEKQLEELPIAREKIKMLQARAEDLEALMIEKTTIERKLSSENQQMRETYEKEAKVNRRLSMENEELQWRLKQAEHSLISGSFSEVQEIPEMEERSLSPVLSPTKSPGPNQSLSRSVFFTYVDKDNVSPHSPRSAYKKITPSFAAEYKASPSKKAPSPMRAKSHSEPLQPFITSTPIKSAKHSTSKSKGSQKRQRTVSVQKSNDVAQSGYSSLPDRMSSSACSEFEVFEQRSEHSDQIAGSLDRLTEQELTQKIMDVTTVVQKKWCSDDIKVGLQSPSHPAAEDMSMSADFSDPKTYYHMTFAVLKETGDVENVSNGNSPVTEVVPSQHSKSEDNVNSSVETEKTVVQVMSLSTHEMNTTFTFDDNKSCTPSSADGEKPIDTK